MLHRLNEILQWAGAFFIGAGHVFNTLGSAYHKDFWNIAAFALGTVLFLIWTVRVGNRRQLTVNCVALDTMAVGLARSFG